MRTLSMAAVPLLIPLALVGQTLNSPSPHFGSLAMPRPERTAQLGVSFDSFTEFGKEVDAQGNYVFESYNGIDETIGLNFVNYSFSGQLSSARSVFVRGTAQVGYGHDQPTRAIQNWLHDIQDLRHVPRGDVRNNKLDFALTAELNQWDDVGGVLQRFFGTGLSLGTPNQDVFLQGGLGRDVWRVNGWDLPTLSGMVRIGWPLRGAVFPADGLSSFYVQAKGSVRLPLGSDLREVARRVGPRWLVYALYIVPDLVGTIHRDSGFFSDPGGEGIPETFGAAAFSFGPDLLVVETWNDTVGGKDKGPTGGGRVYVRFWNIPTGWLP